jgi:hypothetical protein
MQSPTSYCGPLDSAGAPGAGAKPGHARSMPSGSATRRTRGNSSAGGRSQGKIKDKTPSLDSSSLPYPGTLATFQPSLSLPSRSIPRSRGSQNAKPYDNQEQARELKSFNDIVWDLAKRSFVLKLWRESCFFLNTDEKDTTVDRCATEAYEAAVSEYHDSYPDGAALITKYRLQPQSSGALVKCRQVVSGLLTQLVWFIADQIYSSYFQRHFYIWKQLWKWLVQQWLRNMVSTLLSQQEKGKRSNNSPTLRSVWMCLTTPASKRCWSSFFLGRVIAGVEHQVTCSRTSFPSRFLP